MRPTLAVVVVLGLLCPALADPSLLGPPHLSSFGAGDGPSAAYDVLRVLDEALTPAQSNVIAFDRCHEGAYEKVTLRSSMRILTGGDGGCFLFLNTAHYGVRGPAPFLRSWVEPNLEQTFAVGVDVHNPPDEEMFTPWGNYQDLPQREVSLHWDGREIVKRVAPAEFRGDFHDVVIRLEHVVGGAQVSVEIAGAVVFDAYFVPNLLPYEMRPAIGAGTREDATTLFDVKNLALEVGAKAVPRRPPLEVELFHHVMTDNSRTAFEAEADLPPADQSFGRIILTLDIHDGGRMWDEWDRNGLLSVYDNEDKKHAIAPFITSYRTPCHWEVDVTRFRVWLKGKRRFEIAAGTAFYKGRGYLMSASLVYHYGTPELMPFRAVPLWNGRAKYKSAENHFQDFFPPKTVMIDEETKAAELWMTVTGHSQIGEFTPSKRALVVHPFPGAKPERFASELWLTDVYLNPNRPQYGTWQFSRAGWAPGDIVHPWVVDLTPHLRPGAEAELRYETYPYEFPNPDRRPDDESINKANQSVHSYLILYREAGTPAAQEGL